MEKKYVRASNRKHHVVYKTTCTINGRYYIGLHSTDNLNDDYLGSGKRIRRSVNKHGAANHVREILYEFASRKEASDGEKILITREMLQDSNCLNCGPGGLGATDRPATKEETREKMRLSHTGLKLTEEAKLKISAANKGLKRTSGQIEAMKARLTGIKLPPRSEEHIANLKAAAKTAKKRTPMTEETKMKISNSMKLARASSTETI
jgi:hypothetical protein